MRTTPKVVAVAAFAIVAGVAWVALQPKGDSKLVAVSTQTAVIRNEKVVNESPDAPETKLPADPVVEESPSLEVIGAEVAQIDPTPTPDIPGDIDPESQPRAFMTETFRGLEAVPDGFELSGVVLTPEGFALDPNAPKNGDLREGVIVSPVKPTGFPSNAFVPMWKEQVPDSTGILVEFQLSPDGKSWGEWIVAERDEEMMNHRSQTNPDGSVNENASYILGSLHAWPVDQWMNIRYRATLQSGSTENPVLTDFRIYHMDSTLGEGQLANLGGETPNATP